MTARDLEPKARPSDFSVIAVRRGIRRRRRPRSLASRPDPLYPLKIKIALDLGLIDKVRSVGWGGLTSAETGRVGGLMTRTLKGKRRALRLWPGTGPLAERSLRAMQ
ncbi:MAG: small, acid-soluble spore protein, alpha/beta type [Thermaerobacterales bacterium]